jgi:hypothetical protein
VLGARFAHQPRRGFGRDVGSGVGLIGREIGRRKIRRNIGNDIGRIGCRVPLDIGGPVGRKVPWLVRGGRIRHVRVGWRVCREGLVGTRVPARGGRRRRFRLRPRAHGFEVTAGHQQHQANRYPK